jgi:hypothetical protein
MRARILEEGGFVGVEQTKLGGQALAHHAADQVGVDATSREKPSNLLPAKGAGTIRPRVGRAPAASGRRSSQRVRTIRRLSSGRLKGQPVTGGAKRRTVSARTQTGA